VLEGGLRCLRREAELLSRRLVGEELFTGRAERLGGRWRWNGLGTSVTPHYGTAGSGSCSRLHGSARGEAPGALTASGRPSISPGAVEGDARTAARKPACVPRLLGDPFSRRQVDLQWVADGRSECTAVARGSARSVVRRLPDGEFQVPASNKLWAPDSRSWIGLMAGEKSLYVAVQGLDRAGAVRRVPIGFPKGTSVWPDLMQSELLGFIGADRILARPLSDYWGPWVHCYEFSLRAARGDVREYTIQLPTGTADRKVVLSPTGSKLAWILYRVPQGDHEQPGKRQAEQVAISNTDGSNMCVLGEVVPDTRVGLRSLSWLPDESGLTFDYKESRWRVLVPGRFSTAGDR
jgi:hypothetical protein